MAIRKAVRADAARAWSIREQAASAQCRGVYSAALIAAWTRGVPTEAWADSVERDFYLAMDGENPVATGMLNRDSGRIEAVFVLPDRMRQGIGKQMMMFLEHLAREHGLPGISLESTLNAVPFYRCCGFSGECVSTCGSARIMPMDCVLMNKIFA